MKSITKEQLDKNIISVFIQTPALKGELEKNLRCNIDLGMWVLSEDGLKYLSEPSMGRKGSYLYFTLKALKKLFPDVNVDICYYKSNLFRVKEIGDKIVLDEF